jgi:AcrR family transcriptional regulator
MCRSLNLADLSIVLLAETLDVTPGAIYYYIGDKDALLASVISMFWQRCLACFERGVEQSWDARVRAVALSLYREQVNYRGVNSYLMFHNKFHLIQSGAVEDEYSGLQFLEEILRLFRSEGFGTWDSIANARILTHFISASANAAVGKQLAGQHKEYLRKAVARTSKSTFPRIHESLEAFTSFGPDEAFETGLEVLMRGFKGQARQAHQRHQTPDKRSRNVADSPSQNRTRLNPTEPC